MTQAPQRLKANTIGPWLSTVGINDDVILAMNGDSASSGGVLEDLERRTIMKILDKHNGHRLRTAKELGIGLRTLGMKLKKYKDEGILVET